jgi:hypothetical protein
VVLVLLLVAALATIRFRVEGHFHGLFLLKGVTDYRMELRDDLYLGDAQRLVAGIEFTPQSDVLDRWFGNRHEVPFLSYEWIEKDGTGFVVNHLKGGQQIFTSFSRFEFGADEIQSGLFVGGGLPHNVRKDVAPLTNESGMAFSDGKRWFHLWCTANEAIMSARTFDPIYPSQWKYLGSKVVHSNEKELIIKSSHMVEVDNVPLRIERHAEFKAGEPYFVLSFSVTNMGKTPVLYVYLYGDEPWLGNYGTSAGNVGWVKDRLITHVGPIDTDKYHYAGMFDYGNDALNEGHDFTMTANFIEWMSAVTPIVYYANNMLEKYDPSQKAKPLEGNERFIGIHWQPPALLPGKTDTYFLAIGMATRDPKTGMPIKPKTSLYP